MNLKIVGSCGMYLYTLLFYFALMSPTAFGQRLDSIAYTTLNDCISDPISPCKFPDLAQNIYTIDTLSSGKFLIIHPYSTIEEATLIYDVSVDTTNKTILYYSISGHPRGDFHARISVTDQQGNQEFKFNRVIGVGWIEDSIDLSEYRCQNIRIKLHVASDNGQWRFEYAGVDYFYVDTSIDSSFSCPDTLVSKKVELKVFPNPTRSYVNLQLNNKFPAICKLYDFQGKLVYEEEFTSILRIEDISLAQGAYLIKVYNCDQILYSKFIQL